MNRFSVSKTHAKRHYESLYYSKSIIILLFVLGLATVLAGCGNTTAIGSSDNNSSDSTVAQNKKEDKTEPIEVNAWVAAGMKNAISETAPLFEKENNVKLVFNFASSGDLQIQIEQGAPADVFISAGKKQINVLEKKQLLVKESIRNIVANDLVIAAPADSKLTISKIEDLATLGDVKNIAMGNPDQVPAGKYAIQSLQKAGVWEKVKPKIIYTKDVRQISTYLDSGNVDLGFVYSSELKVAKNIKPLLLVPDFYHDPIVFTGAVVKNAKQQDLGGKFIDFLLRDEAQKNIQNYGFKPVSK